MGRKESWMRLVEELAWILLRILKNAYMISFLFGAHLFEVMNYNLYTRQQSNRCCLAVWEILISSKMLALLVERPHRTLLWFFPTLETLFLLEIQTSCKMLLCYWRGPDFLWDIAKSDISCWFPRNIALRVMMYYMHALALALALPWTAVQYASSPPVLNGWMQKK